MSKNSNKTEDLEVVDSPVENTEGVTPNPDPEAVIPGASQEPALELLQAPEASTFPVAIYKGRSVVVRRITEADWRSVGVNMKTQEWSRKNRHLVDISDWPDEAVEVLRNDPKFEIRGR